MSIGIYPRTEQGRLKMSLAKLGKKFPNRKKPPPFTEEHKAKLLKANEKTRFKKGHKHPPEVLEKLRISHLGKPSGRKGIKSSEETRKKISEANKRRFADKTNHPRWKADRSSLAKKQIRNDYAYVDWRKQVWLRDNFKCKLANSDCKGRIEAHHILVWKDYPELRYEVNNGITLCHAHHPRVRAEEKRLAPIFQELVSVSK